VLHHPAGRARPRPLPGEDRAASLRQNGSNTRGELPVGQALAGIGNLDDQPVSLHATPDHDLALAGVANRVDHQVSQDPLQAGGALHFRRAVGVGPPDPLLPGRRGAASSADSTAEPRGNAPRRGRLFGVRLHQLEQVVRHNFDRLTQTKKKYDPGNFFHVNQNIAAG